MSLPHAAFGKLAYIIHPQRSEDSKIPINLKRKMYDACVLPVKLQQLRICQRAIDREMLGISEIDKKMRISGQEPK